MSRIKTCVLALVFALSAHCAATALPQSPSERVQLFASCAGRFSALADHHRLFDGAASEVAEFKKASFEALLEATLPDAIAWGMPGRMAFDWRMTAKMAQATLLHRSTFTQDAYIKVRSRETAAAYLQFCEGQVLGL